MASVGCGTTAEPCAPFRAPARARRSLRPTPGRGRRVPLCPGATAPSPEGGPSRSRRFWLRRETSPRCLFFLHPPPPGTEQSKIPEPWDGGVGAGVPSLPADSLAAVPVRGERGVGCGGGQRPLHRRVGAARLPHVSSPVETWRCRARGGGHPRTCLRWPFPLRRRAECRGCEHPVAGATEGLAAPCSCSSHYTWGEGAP